MLTLPQQPAEAAAHSASATQGRGRDRRDGAGDGLGAAVRRDHEEPKGSSARFRQEVPYAALGKDVGRGVRIIVDHWYNRAHSFEQKNNPVTDRFLASVGLELADADDFICHPGGARVLEARRRLQSPVRRPRGVPGDPARLRQHVGGHRSFVLRRVLETPATDNGRRGEARRYLMTWFSRARCRWICSWRTASIPTWKPHAQQSNALGDDVLDPVFADIVGAEETHDALYWVERTARRGHEIRERTIARLVSRGILLEPGDDGLLSLTAEVAHAGLSIDERSGAGGRQASHHAGSVQRRHPGPGGHRDHQPGRCLRRLAEAPYGRGTG